jgi:pilus assembly protein CpaF
MSAAWVSPLVEVERAVQERAKAVSLDMSSPGAAAQLRGLIRDEVERWSDDHRRGLRPFDLADPDALAQRAERNLVGYGPLGPLLEDDDVWEIMVNGPDGAFDLASSTIQAQGRPTP